MTGETILLGIAVVILCVLLGASEEKYKLVKQQAMVLNRENEGYRQMVAEMKSVFNLLGARPLQASMTDQQVINLGNAISEIVKHNSRSTPDKMN